MRLKRTNSVPFALLAGGAPLVTDSLEADLDAGPPFWGWTEPMGVSYWHIKHDNLQLTSDIIITAITSHSDQNTHLLVNCDNSVSIM